MMFPQTAEKELAVMAFIELYDLYRSLPQIPTVEFAKKKTFKLPQVYSSALSFGQTILMQFSKTLRERVKTGEITTSIRFWKYPHVMAGSHYKLDGGEVIITSIREINFDDISEAIARKSGFSSLAALLNTAQHGTGHHIYFIRFYYMEKSN
jgi:hypothetical protein